MITQADEPDAGGRAATRASAEGVVTHAGQPGPVAEHPREAGDEPSAPHPHSVADVLYWMSASGVLMWAMFVNFFKLGPALIMTDEYTYAVAAWRYVQGTVSPPLQISAGSNTGAAHVIGQNSSQINADNFEHPPLAKWLFGLAQLVAGHQSVTADRVVTAIATVLAGVVVALWVSRMAGRWTGLLAGALVVLLPEAVEGSAGLRFARFGMLDPVAELFFVVYLWLIWEWWASGRRRAWLFAAASGIAVGCATASKENGFVGAVVPILVCLLTAWREPRLLLRRLGQAAIAMLASLGAFAAMYAPFSSPLKRIIYMVEFQAIHSNDGHLVGLAGHATWHPPWWANLWFAGHGMGSAVTVFVLAFASLACVLRHDRAVVFCLAALAGPIVFHCFIAGVTLPFYWTLWTPPLLVLTALGVIEVVRRLAAMTSVPAAVPAGVTALALVVPVLSALSLTVHTAQVKPTGPEVLRSVLHHHGLRSPVLSSGVYGYEYAYYDVGMIVYLSPPRSLAGLHAVVIGAPRCRLEPDNRTTRAIAAVNLAAGNLRRIYSDSAMTVYAVERPLISPTSAQIAAQPPVNLAAGC